MTEDASMILARRNTLVLIAVVALLGREARAQAPAHPWRLGDLPPAVEGVHLGDTRESVVSALGEPDPMPPGLSDPSADLQTLRYRHGALMIGLSRSAGVVRILLRKPDGGSLAGVRVGDRLGALIRLWGEPPTGAGSVGRYPMGDWTVSVRGDMGPNVVMSIMLTRAQAPAAIPPPVAPPPPVN